MGHTLYDASHYEDEETIKKNLELSNADQIHGNDNEQICTRACLCVIFYHIHMTIII